MVRRTKIEAEATRNQILDAAEVVFFELGVARATLSDIAAHAGVTRGAIYWHFRNKADLIEAMLDRVSLPMQEIANALPAAESTDPLGDLQRTTVQMLRRVSTDKQTQRVFDILINKCELVDDMEVAREPYLKCRGRCMETMERGLRAAKALRQLRKGVTPRNAAIGLHALVEGLVSSWLLKPGEFAIGSVAEVVVGAYIEGLRSS
ncbi:MAG: TetR family transcriptional regulator [Gammaproteobacteria bacterium]|nr:TetR family transcriptional regulator [Gammaproteobacteria bacterium]MCG3144020.1 HTH-type transcriptional regulator TtgR [Gammaproteobacteria bacterium]